MMQYSEYVQQTTFFCQKGHCNLFNRKNLTTICFTLLHLHCILLTRKKCKEKKDIFQDVEYLQVNMKIFSIVCNESEWVVASQYQQCFYE